MRELRELSAKNKVGKGDACARKERWPAGGFSTRDPPAVAAVTCILNCVKDIYYIRKGVKDVYSTKKDSYFI